MRRSRSFFTALAVLVFGCGETEPENQGPLATEAVPDITLLRQDTATVDLSRHFSDPDGDPLSYRAESRDHDVLSISVDRSALVIVALRPGVARVRVSAMDSDSAEAMQEFGATVKTVPAVSDRIPDQAMRAGSETMVLLWQYFEDPDGDSLVYEATATTSDTGLEVSVEDSTLTIAAGGGSAMATVRVTVSDGLGEASQTFEVAVTMPPAITDTIPGLVLRADSSTTIQVGSFFTDPDTDELAYSASSRWPGVARVSIRDSTLVIRAGHLPAGTPVEVSAADEMGEVTQTFEVSVKPPPAVWREDFDSLPTEWELVHRRGESSIEAEDGALAIGLLSRPAFAIVNSDSVVGIEDGWTVSVGATAEDSELCSSFAAMTGDTITHGWRLDVSWRLHQWGAWISRKKDVWTLIRSGGLPAETELEENITTSMSLVDDKLTWAAMNRVLLEVELEDLWNSDWEDTWPTKITSIKFSAGNVTGFCGGTGFDGKSTARFDWVEMGFAK